MLRVVIDTNIWVSALINPAGHPAQILEAFYQQQFKLVTSRPLIAELSRVFGRRHIVRRRADMGRRSIELLIFMRNTADVVELGPFESVARDSDDDVVIATMIQGAADILVTRDDDLKFDSNVAHYLAAYGREVCSVARFLELLAAEDSGP